MYTHLCLTQLLNQQTRRFHNRNSRPSERSEHSQGQVLVIFAVSLVALLLFVGLAVDAGSLYLTYDQLKRAVDASAVSAANDFKRGVSVTEMTTGAEEVLKLHNVDIDQTTLQVYTCESDANLSTDVPTFYNLCPHGTESKRKLVWVQATEKAPLYFLSLLGIPPVTLTTNSISEAAPIDLVIVLDTSTSMGVNSPGYSVNDYNPDTAGACNSTNTCYPLRYAKDAAKSLIDSLYQGYDQVAVVKFAQIATVVHPLDYNLGQNDTGGAGNAEPDIDSGVTLHYDPPFSRMWTTWQGVSVQGHNYLAFNPVNPEDRNGDGSENDDTAFTMANGSYPVCANYNSGPGGGPPTDYLTGAATTYSGCCFPNLVATGPDPYPTNWDYTKDPFGWGGVPCDLDTLNDSYNWSLDNGGQGPYNANDNTQATNWLTQHAYPATSYPVNTPAIQETLSPLSTCSGCGIRLATDILKAGGRPTAVWIMVFLSDGGVNMSDTPKTDPLLFPGGLTNAYPNGFCSGALGTDGTMHMTAGVSDPQGYWYDGCTDKNIYQRWCIDASQSTCAPSSYSTGTHTFTTSWNTTQNNGTNVANWAYSPLDYAMDMVDQAALTVVKAPAGGNAAYYNQNELTGNDMAIYSIGVGNGLGATGEAFLRYMAAVGDDGDRVTDPCDGAATKQNCGNYYWTDGTPGDLNKIFEDIASRIYTRITG
ncbi:MAG: VWA domain-containing protein [Anaerolineaceae bacterium]|nr:VWA domain-containing protein [Anaerolineaceae bacterium]